MVHCVSLALALTLMDEECPREPSVQRKISVSRTWRVSPAYAVKSNPADNEHSLCDGCFGSTITIYTTGHIQFTSTSQYSTMS